MNATAQLTDSHRGIWSSTKQLLEGLLATIQNRVELFAVEMREERCRLIEAILWAAAVAVCGLMTVALGTLAVIVLFWDSARVAALLGLAGFYLGAAALAWGALQRRLNSKSGFIGTLTELQKDRSCLHADNSSSFGGGSCSCSSRVE